MSIRIILGLLAIPLSGICLVCLRHLDELETKRPVEVILITPILWILGLNILIAGAVSKIEWQATSLPIILMWFGASLAILSFCAAMFVETKNRNNNYTIKKRFAKYALQELAFVGLSLFGGTMIARVGLNTLLPTLPFGRLFSLLLATVSFSCCGYKTVKAVINTVWCIRAENLRPNSKELKALRKSPRA